MFRSYDSQLLENKTILIVDDNALSRKILKEQLEKALVNVIMADNGNEAIQIAKEILPDMILLDIMMPVVSGFDVCLELKENYETKDIPIIFLTAKIDTEDIVKGLRLGAVDYINKPFLHPEELIARITTQIELKIYRDSLVIQNETLNQINQEKNDFIATIVHDLKNPIFNISLISKTLQKANKLTTEDIIDLANDIEISSNKILNLINSILELASFENNKKIVPELLNVNEIILSSTYLQKESAKFKGININLVENNEQIFLNTDRNAFIQIYDNILSNAIKYSPFDSEVKIDYYIVDNYFKVNVKDSGPGISKDEQKKMFGKFAKLSSKPTGNETSTGLGLFSVKLYSELIGAEIKVDSTLGEGSTFSIIIPLR